MEKIILKPLKSKKQLNEISQGVEPVKAGFDETGTYFNATYRLNDGQLCDITIDFNTRQPKILISNYYSEV